MNGYASRSLCYAVLLYTMIRYEIITFNIMISVKDMALTLLLPPSLRNKDASNTWGWQQPKRANELGGEVKRFMGCVERVYIVGCGIDKVWGESVMRDCERKGRQDDVSVVTMA